MARAGLTTRAAALGLVVCALVVSAALPLREFLSQRGRIAAAVSSQDAQKQRVEALQKQFAQLQDPAYVRSQARLRLHFVLPGEIAYVVIEPSARPRSAGKADLSVATTTTGAESPWYSEVWGSVEAADRPVALPSPKP